MAARKIRVEINEIKDSIQNLIEEQNDFDIVEQQIDNLRNEAKTCMIKCPYWKKDKRSCRNQFMCLKMSRKDCLI